MIYLKSQNKGNGFWAEMAFENIATESWDMTMEEIIKETGANQAEARAFLDSTAGRHFASSVIDFLQNNNIERAIRLAIARWNSWKLRESTRRELGIPLGLTYLQGMIWAASEAA